MTEKRKQETEENKQRHAEHSVWKWIDATAGLTLVTFALGTTAYRAITEESTPPILEISVDSIVPTADGYLVKFRVKNTGNQTAAALTIEGSLKLGEESVETSTTTLNYAPANSQREGGLFFTKPPQEFDLQIRPLGYGKP